MRMERWRTTTTCMAIPHRAGGCAGFPGTTISRSERVADFPVEGRFGGPRRGGPPPDAAAFPPPRRPDMPMPPPFGSGTDILQRQVGERWPLIQRVLADEVYAARYREYLARALEGLAAPGTIDTRVRELHALIAPHVVGRRGERPTAHHHLISSGVRRRHRRARRPALVDREPLRSGAGRACGAHRSMMTHLAANRGSEPETPRALAALREVGAELLAARALLTRVDRSYLLPREALDALLSSLRDDYGVLRAGTRLAARYSTRYFDTSDLRMYDDHRRGRCPRYKVRMRHHLDRKLSFLEVKRKGTNQQTTRPLQTNPAMLTGEIGRTLDYQAGLFAGDGRGRGSRAGRTSAGRVTWTIVRDLELAGTFSEGRTRAVDADPANGLAGRAPSGYRFFDRVYVKGQRIRVGADLEWSPRSWRFAAEAIRAKDERRGQGLDLEDLPGTIATGWSAAVVKQIGRRRGQARSRLREWDLGLRYDELAFDDAGPATSSDSVRPRATDVRPRAARTLTGSLSWAPARWSRVMGERWLRAIHRGPEPRLNQVVSATGRSGCVCSSRSRGRRRPSGRTDWRPTPIV